MLIVSGPEAERAQELVRSAVRVAVTLSRLCSDERDIGPHYSAMTAGLSQRWLDFCKKLRQSEATAAIFHQAIESDRKLWEATAH